MAEIKGVRENLEDLAFLYEDENEKRLHMNAIQMLAMHVGESPVEIEEVYEMILSRYKKYAKVRDFLPILVSKEVKHLISSSRKEKHISP